ncbi:MAG TPA: tRNA lysidine(34) synthetase TilS [Phenylobacterium sp.]|uniref:tRNA lysidine(34) synthetase TilS n=1 Tax=Phenylobacterium sp. TaxID=1871053 RepID=UPI002D3B70D4|nr:tRNA lysidine(34) synthetase TilS [Phenylobacterium sp.]HZZ67611.1 tRNA lysidine(34) synthetase TilS [Phenylobacterium sp.]
MRLAALDPLTQPTFEGEVGAILDRRLLSDSRRPIAVALSGGGDSLALSLLAADWARRIGRRLLVLTVDHRLRPQSAAWTNACAATAERLRADFRALAWTGEKPAAGLPAAARAARHALLADAARQAGAWAILMGHTADDGLEAGLMRQAGSTTPDPREWAPSPVWPQGRGVFLLRPMLRTRRGDIRAWLTARGETWIDDPANEDRNYARPRARAAVAQGAAPAAAKALAPAEALALASRPEARGGLEIARTDLVAAQPDAAARFVAAACLCAAGTDRPPARDKVERLLARLAEDAPFAASLAGARVTADGPCVRFQREPGEASRGGLQPLALRAGETGVWDGRFEITAARAVEVRALRRTTLPAAADGGVEGLTIRPLSHDRLLAACGAIERELA